MTDYREINAIQRDPPRARRLGEILLTLKDIEWTDWERDFLESMSREREADLTTRQAEKLVELREASVWYSVIDGFSVRRLIRACCDMRHLLSEHDEEFVVRLNERGISSVRRKDGRRLMRCARITGEIEPYQGWSLERSDADND